MDIDQLAHINSEVVYQMDIEQPAHINSELSLCLNPSVYSEMAFTTVARSLSPAPGILFQVKFQRNQEGSNSSELAWLALGTGSQGRSEL